MRRILLVLLVGIILVLAGCIGDTADDPGDDIVGDTDPGDDVDTDDETDDANDDQTGTNDDIDRDTDDDPPPSDDSEPVDPDGELEIHHIDVSQADATLILTPDGETILIDTGDWRQAGSEVITYLEELQIERIDHLIATHAHADHIGGHDEIIAWAEEEGDGIGTAYDSGVPHDSATYERYLDAIEDYDVDLQIAEEGDELPIEDDTLSALFVNPPEGESGNDLHYNSLSLVFEFGEFTYVTTGDAEQDAEDRMVDEWSDELEGDVYQAGHHGSSTSSTQPFLDAVDPSIAVISSGYDSQYGHPHDEVLEEFDERGIETYWTGVHGDVVLITDGDSIAVETSEEFSTDPADLLAEKPDDD